MLKYFYLNILGKVFNRFYRENGKFLTIIKPAVTIFYFPGVKKGRGGYFFIYSDRKYHYIYCCLCIIFYILRYKMTNWDHLECVIFINSRHIAGSIYTRKIVKSLTRVGGVQVAYLLHLSCYSNNFSYHNQEYMYK